MCEPIEGDPTSPTVCAQEDNTVVPIPTNILCYYGRQNLGIDEETGNRIWVDGTERMWWLQERVQNKWQAHDPIHPLGSGPVAITAVDWGDLLESGALNTRQIRTEMTLFKDVTGDPVYGDEIATQFGGTCDATVPDDCFTAFQMSGAVPGTDQSINEIQGNDFGPGGTVNPGTETVIDPFDLKGYHATVYSACARLVIQRLTAEPAALGWSSEAGYWIGDAAPPIVNISTYGGTYGAEVNAGGNLIYGYNWNAKNVAIGKYRLTYVLDGGERCPYPLSTLFDNDTAIINLGEAAPGSVLSQDDLMILGGNGSEGGAAYVDISIKAKGGGKPR